MCVTFLSKYIFLVQNGKYMTKKRETIANQEESICEEEFNVVVTVSVVVLGFSVDPVVVDVVVGVVVDLVVVKSSGWRICWF